MTSYAKAIFCHRLKMETGLPLRLRINCNRSTVLSVSKRDGLLSVSVHEIFMSAPLEVFSEIVRYIKQPGGSLGPLVKSFIERELPSSIKESNRPPPKLRSLGEVFDLQEIYEAINAKYFGAALELLITWGREGRGRSPWARSTQICFGTYHDDLKLIRINPILDKSMVPSPCINL